MKTLVTHNGGFHADDVFAAATLFLVFKGEEIKIERTRDPEIIKTGDIIFDIGYNYDGKKFFDHHQKGGAGTRENGIPFASFGLIWKHFGKDLVEDEAFKYVDEKLVQSIDAIDNGIYLLENSRVSIFTISDVIGSFNLIGEEGKDEEKKQNEAFLKALGIAKQILERMILEAKDFETSIKIYKQAYEESSDKRLVITEHHIRKDCISAIPDVLYVVHPYHNNTWAVRATRKNNFSFESKKPMPQEWGGKVDEELQKVTGIADAIFCHRGLHLINAQSKEGAITLAKKALEA